MGEAVRRRIDALLDAAERGESSLVPPGEKDRKALLRRGLELTQPLSGQFVRRGTWRRLNPAERSLWLMRGACRAPSGLALLRGVGRGCVWPSGDVGAAHARVGDGGAGLA